MFLSCLRWHCSPSPHTIRDVSLDFTLHLASPPTILLNATIQCLSHTVFLHFLFIISNSMCSLFFIALRSSLCVVTFNILKYLFTNNQHLVQHQYSSILMTLEFKIVYLFVYLSSNISFCF